MSELKQRIDSVARKAELLTTRYTLLRGEKKAAEERIAELEATVASQAQKIEELERQLEYLTVISVVEPKADDRINVRKRLAQLLHDIDQCIADLSDCNE
ncbi:MAG: DUF3450 domain-containing protein [Pseudoflavonifractor sp.]|nr:DUF3450 domain-containing protein [Alloprevotella sp.]MCM1117550.1 DUF3450 domain-containing protein [Pseudoflavonifractor sp.]